MKSNYILSLIIGSYFISIFGNYSTPASASQFLNNPFSFQWTCENMCCFPYGNDFNCGANCADGSNVQSNYGHWSMFESIEQCGSSSSNIINYRGTLKCKTATTGSWIYATNVGPFSCPSS